MLFMKKIELTQNKYTIVDDEDYEELNKYNWYTRKDRYVSYAVRTDNKLNKIIYMHRVIMKFFNPIEIDHINGNGLDNRKENLRICTRSQNNGNIRIPRHNTSGIKGVSWYRPTKKWVAQIGNNSKRVCLGYFSSKLEAKSVYTLASEKYFGEFYSDGIRKEDKKLQKEVNNIKLEKKERLYSHNVSGIRGVGWHKGSNKWRARIVINGKQKYLGTFPCIADAKAAYDVAAGNILND